VLVVTASQDEIAGPGPHEEAGVFAAMTPRDRALAKNGKVARRPLADGEVKASPVGCDRLGRSPSNIGGDLGASAENQRDLGDAEEDYQAHATGGPGEHATHAIIGAIAI
jgi:hypothetical protein